MKTLLKHLGTGLALCVGTCMLGNLPVEANTPETTVNKTLSDDCWNQTSILEVAAGTKPASSKSPAAWQTGKSRTSRTTAMPRASLAAGLQAHSTWGCSIGRRSVAKTAISIGFGKSSIAKVGR